MNFINNRGSCFTLLTIVTFAVAPRSHGFHNGLLFRVLDGVRRGVDFFSSDYSHVNIDGLFGMRLGQGQLLDAIEECKNVDCSQNLYDTLVLLENKLNNTASHTMAYVEAADRLYFERFHLTIDTPYRMPYTRVRFGTLHDIKLGDDTDYDEEIGDGCFSRLMGSYKENGELIPKCNITNACWDMMTGYGKARYTLTHQLLYFVTMEHVGCGDAAKEWRNHVDMHQIETHLCKQILKEASGFTEGGDVAQIDRDLFLEQSLLCGSLGFEDFLKTNWMRIVLKWQTHDGCFRNEMFTDRSSYDKGMDVMLHGKTRATGRRLLREQFMKDGCLSHMSGLGFGLLCTYLKKLILYL